MKMINEDIEKDRFFYDEFGFERIGLGRNMVKSLKFWTLATNILTESKNDDQKPIHRITAFGQMVYEYDRFIRLSLTSSLLHYFLASEKQQASSWYWFFNESTHRSATFEEVFESLKLWVQSKSKKQVSDNTLKRDLECLRQLYTIGSNHTSDPEEVVISPLSSLRLLHENRDVFAKKTPNINELDLDSLYFILLKYCKSNQVQSLTLEEIQYKPLLWGKIFNLTSNQILAVLEQIQTSKFYHATFIRTNQIYNLNIPEEDPYSFLEKAYQRKVALHDARI